MESQNVTEILYKDKKIYLIGTAHILKESMEEVKTLIQDSDPDTICVELCQSRYDSLKDEKRWQNLDIMKVIKAGKGFMMLVNMILTSFQQKAGVDVGGKAGDEMMAAIKIAEEENKNLILADRDVNVSFQRVWRLSGLKEKLKLVYFLFDALFFGEEVSKDDIDEIMKGEDLFTESMDLFSKNMPIVKKTMLDERNEYIAEKIRKAPGQTVVAVIGKGHLQGIADLIEKDMEYSAEIETAPAPSRFSKLIPWIFPAVIILLFVIGFINGGADKAVSMLGAWIVANGVFTSAAALAVLAHPVTIIGAWVVSPLTSLNPTIGAGIVLSIVEAYFHQPRVSDLENIPVDILSVKGFYKNRVTKILLVFFATSIGSSIGTFVGIPWLTAMLGK